MNKKGWIIIIFIILLILGGFLYFFVFNKSHFSVCRKEIIKCHNDAKNGATIICPICCDAEGNPIFNALDRSKCID